MADLIDFNQVFWKEDRVKHLFLHHEVEAILRIPLNLAWPAWPEDKFIWHFSSNCIHMVELSGNNLYELYWQLWWTLNSLPWSKVESTHHFLVQAKVRMFLWRAALNIFSSRKNFLRRVMFNYLDCGHYGSQFEDDRHTFLDFIF